MLRRVHQNEIDVNDKLSERITARCSPAAIVTVSALSGRLLHEEYLRRWVDLGDGERLECRRNKRWTPRAEQCVNWDATSTSLKQPTTAVRCTDLCSLPVM